MEEAEDLPDDWIEFRWVADILSKMWVYRDFYDHPFRIYRRRKNTEKNNYYNKFSQEGENQHLFLFTISPSEVTGPVKRKKRWFARFLATFWKKTSVFAAPINSEWKIVKTAANAHLAQNVALFQMALSKIGFRQDFKKPKFWLEVFLTP